MNNASLIELARHAHDELLGPNQVEWLDQLKEHQTLLLALTSRSIVDDEVDRALELTGNLGRFWWMSGQAQLAMAPTEASLALAGGAPAHRASALVAAGSLKYALGDFESSLEYFHQGLQLLEPAENWRLAVHGLDSAGMAARQMMDLDAAEDLHRQALELHRIRTDGSATASALQALCLNNLGVVSFFRGHLDSALQRHEEASAIRVEIGDLRGQASSLNNQGQVLKFLGQPQLALERFQNALEIREQLNDRWGEAGSHIHIAIAQAQLEKKTDALNSFSKAYQGFQFVNDPVGVCECLEALAEITHGDQPKDAVSLIAVASARRQELPSPRSPVHENHIQGFLDELSNRLGDEEFNAAKLAAETDSKVSRWIDRLL